MVDDEAIALGRLISPAVADGVGLCWWDIVANNFCGDEEVARLFSMNSAEIQSGVTIERLLGCLHSCDRERIAKSLHTAILNGSLCREPCRVHMGKGRYRHIVIVLRCFGFSDGFSTACAGFLSELRPAEALVPHVAKVHSNVVQLRNR